MNNKTQRILQSYLFSRVQSIPKRKNIDLILEQQQRAVIMASLSLENLISIKQIKKATERGLNALFQNQSLSAKQSYITANNIIQSSKLNDEASLVIKDEFNASKSYFDYRERNYESAKVNLQIALESCMALVNKYDYDFLQGRPVHLTCNLLKIEACSGNKEKAIKIACYLISIINGNHNDLLFKDIDFLKPVQHLSFKDEDFFLTQVFEEIAKLLASCQDKESNELINLATDFLEECNSPLDTQGYREYTWFKNKQTLAQGKINDFLEESSKFLAEGRGHCKLLWHATVLDILKIYQTIDSKISRKLQQQIIEDFAKYPYLPSVLKV